MENRVSVLCGQKGSKGCKTEKALLLHSAGMDVQEIFATLTDPGPPSGGTNAFNMYEELFISIYSKWMFSYN